MPVRYPSHLLKLIDSFRKFPGVGTKSAERFAFKLMDWPAEEIVALAQVIQQIPIHLKTCHRCGCLMEKEACPFCSDNQRNKEMICVIASAKDAFSIEQTGQYQGLYHVIHHLLNPLQNQSHELISIESLIDRIDTEGIKEIILALDPTIEGDATCLYLKKELEYKEVKVFRLALGIPLGSSLDFVDGGTLAQAIVKRCRF